MLESNAFGTLDGRFLTWNIPAQPDGAADPEATKQKLTEAVGHVDTVPVPSEVPFSDDVQKYLVMLGGFLARARTTVRRDSYSRDVIKMPEVDCADTINQLAQLLKGLTALRELR